MKIRNVFKIILAVGILVGQNGWAAPKTYDLDMAHSHVGFRIRHLVGKVRGNFEKFSGTIVFDDKAPMKSSVTVTIDAASINTGIEKRDNHLRSADFFDAEKFPHLTFISTKVSEAPGGGLSVAGDLSLHGVTKPVVLTVEKGEAAAVMGGHRLGFSAKAKLNRKDFGLTWNKILEAGLLLVGEEVEIELEIEAVAKP